MNKRMRIKNVVKITSFCVLLIGVITATSILSKEIFINLSDDNDSSNTYVMEGIADDSIPVIKEVKEITINKPFTDNNISVEVNFYDTNSDNDRKEKSLLLFDKTYMPSTGILYGSEKDFDIVSMLDGEVESVEDDELLGKIITIKHSNNLVSKYSSVKDVKVKAGDKVTKGSIIAISNSNKLIESNSSLLIELIDNGKYVNPENYYDKNINDIN